MNALLVNISVRQVLKMFYGLFQIRSSIERVILNESFSIAIRSKHINVPNFIKIETRKQDRQADRKA